MSPPVTSIIKPALIVVDLQEDFLPPNGSLAVSNGRDTIPIINNLLTLPFHLKIATKDWHPSNHISFASNHAVRLWPPHCIQDTLGSEFPFELDTNKFTKTILKGQNPDVEMYSAFYDPLKNPRCSDSGLATHLKNEGITHVYVVGLAADYCVKCTAEDSATEGFNTFIIEEGTRAVDPTSWETMNLGLKGVKVVSVTGEEVNQVRKLGN
ncbi:isochorismatase [Botrytis cinerea]